MVCGCAGWHRASGRGTADARFCRAKESGPAISVSKIPTKPEQIAKESPLVQANMEKLQAFASSLKDGGLQEKVKGVLQNPAPTFLSQY